MSYYIVLCERTSCNAGYARDLIDSFFRNSKITNSVRSWLGKDEFVFCLMLFSLRVDLEVKRRIRDEHDYRGARKTSWRMRLINNEIIFPSVSTNCCHSKVLREAFSPRVAHAQFPRYIALDRPTLFSLELIRNG